jgi:opacity protein-like surface antigen
MIEVSQLDVTPGGKMRNLLILGVLILVVAAPVRSQEYPKAEAFGGYQYLRLNPGGTSCQGFGGSATGNLNNWFGVVGDFGYCRVTGLPSGTSAHAVNFLFGPRATYRSSSPLSPFAQVLFGGQHFGGSGGGTANSFAMSLGGGADYKLTEHVALRLIQVEYLYTHFGGVRQNNARIESGIVYRWGGK